MKKILIVDDELAIAELISDSLEDEGFETVIKTDGRTAYEYIEENKDDISLITLDIMMPEMSGVDLCKYIRSSVECPILFVSAETETGAVYLGDMTCRNLKVKSQTGDVTFKTFDVLEFISVETDTGVVTEKLLSGKTFHTETGQDDIPESNVKGTVEIRTEKGKTEIEIIGD